MMTELGTNQILSDPFHASAKCPVSNAQDPGQMKSMRGKTGITLL